ncbi:hypothetical protein [Rhizobium jaguaris]|uniref:hypothetical protein n=1 Tax=Rhizobium jaguaris TaxID=1312183 RepID=UPI00267D400F
MLHFHFEFHRLDPEMNANKLGADHHEMIAAIRTRDTEAAERIAHDHAMQFKGRFIQFLTNNVRDALRSA